MMFHSFNYNYLTSVPFAVSIELSSGLNSAAESLIQIALSGITDSVGFIEVATSLTPAPTNVHNG